MVGEREVAKHFAIGDIHGCLSHLRRMMEILEPEFVPERDTIIFLGDYVDRGPDPKGVIEYVLELRKELPRVICLKGNHEAMLLDWVLNGKNYDLYLYNGGGTTIRSYSTEGSFQLPPDHLRFFEGLRLFYETDDYIFVHAGVREGCTLGDQDPLDVLWIRDEFIYTAHGLNKLVIFGHTPYHEPFMAPDKIGIDTGAVYGGGLTCLELPAFRFYRVGPHDLP